MRRSGNILEDVFLEWNDRFNLSSEIIRSRNVSGILGCVLQRGTNACCRIGIARYDVT